MNVRHRTALLSAIVPHLENMAQALAVERLLPYDAAIFALYALERAGYTVTKKRKK